MGVRCEQEGAEHAALMCSFVQQCSGGVSVYHLWAVRKFNTA